MATDVIHARARQALARNLWWLIIGRVSIALGLMFLSSAPWNWGRAFEPGRALLEGGLSIFLVVVALSLGYAAALRFSTNYKLQINLQLAGDVIIATWLVWVTGDASSPYTALYIIIIPIAGVLAGPRGALVTSVGCVVAFTGVMLPTALGIVPRFGAGALDSPISGIIQRIGLNDVAFLVVGLLASRLAERQWRSDVRLAAATQSLATLRALHERIVESIRSGVITTDLEGRIFTFNAAAEEITDYTQDELKGRHISMLFGDINFQIAESIRAARAGETSPRYESECVTPDGLRLWLGFTIFPLSVESGEMSGFVITFQDMTQIRGLEETKRRQDRLAAVGRMAASIAHEIRNPLAAMRGSIQVLRSDFDSASPQAQLMDIVLRESDRLNRIITDYLAYARPKSAAAESVDLCELIKETFALMRHSPETRDDHVFEQELPDQPMITAADPSQLKQVFWNLSRNALAAMPDGGTLSIQLRRVRSGRVTITFADTGRGMSPEQVERLFEPFTSTTGGTGLGLSIVYQIVREHGGTINVRSLEGTGTTITIELPEEQGIHRSAGGHIN